MKALPLTKPSPTPARPIGSASDAQGTVCSRKFPAMPKTSGTRPRNAGAITGPA
jgi:hypothetical protein